MENKYLGVGMKKRSYYVIGCDIMNTWLQTLSSRLGPLLEERGLTLALAESCTGGMIAKIVTDVPGSSGYFNGGVVAYSNAVKERVLGVPVYELESYGAVSSEVALAMATGVRKLLDSHVGLSVTGIAGPGGGSPDKPVGLVYIGLAVLNDSKYIKCLFEGDREKVREATAAKALEELIGYLRADG